MKIESGANVSRPLKTSEGVARDIVQHVVAGQLVQGDSLPSEAKMLEQYGVSRESLREGLRLLEAQGLITLRRGPGGGPVVGTVDPANLGRVSTLYYRLAGATYGELFEAWIVAGGSLAQRAAHNEDRQLVRNTLLPYVDLDDITEMPIEDFGARHTQFHNDVGALAGNRVMQLSLMAIGQTVMHHIGKVAYPREIMDILLDDHRRIANAIVTAKPAKALDQMRIHLERLTAYYGEVSARDVVDQLIEWR